MYSIDKIIINNSLNGLSEVRQFRFRSYPNALSFNKIGYKKFGAGAVASSRLAESLIKSSHQVISSQYCGGRALQTGQERPPFIPRLACSSNLTICWEECSHATVNLIRPWQVATRTPYLSRPVHVALYCCWGQSDGRLSGRILQGQL